ncbi:MAG: 5-formyltetrahydrofolate cyclo-ligase [Lachnospiraceae bacterium]|nr:5-formyltetrahydrofolate cyclo-ligase [Lachnospiraceae bacterium]
MEREALELAKKELRRSISKKKKELSADEILIRSERIFKHLQECEEFIKADEIYAYMNYNAEVHMQSLIERLWEQGRKVYLPKVEGEEMNFYEVHSMKDLASGCKGILEPVEDCNKALNPRGVMIVPGLAFDPMGGRIGYGGGFYDKYLERYPEFFTIGLGFDFQLVSQVPRGEWDRGLDLVITESQRIKN